MTEQLKQAAQQALEAWQTSCYGQPAHQRAMLFAMTKLGKMLEGKRALTTSQPAQAGEVDEQRRFEAGSVVLQYLRDTGAPYRAMHHMLIALHGDPEAKLTSQQATPEPVALIREMATRIKAANPGDAFFTLQILDALVKKLSDHARATPPQQAAGEPVGKVVAWVYGDDIYWHNAPDLNDHIRASGRPMVFGDTHPAPGVPDGVLDAKYFARNGTGFDTCPTRLLPQSEEARKVDEWWLRYFAAADAQVRKHALTMLAAAQAKGGDPEDLAAAGVMLTGRRSDHA